MSQPLDLFQPGDTIFFDLLRRCSNPGTLRDLARRWLAAKAPALRARLHLYLDQPLEPNHKPLVLALLREAARAGDDDVLARMMVLFDRCLCRDWVLTYHPGGQGTRRVLLPNPPPPLEDDLRREEDAFPVATRLRARRFAWRYFARLGKRHPERYVAALAPALKAYTDADVGDGFAILDRWGLLHALYHHSTVIRPRRNGWYIKDGLPWLECSLAPAPAYRELWEKQPLVLYDLVRHAQSAFVRRWATRLLGELDSVSLALLLPLDELLPMLGASSPERVRNAIDLLKGRGGLEKVPDHYWVRLLRAQKTEAVHPLLLELIEQSEAGWSGVGLRDLVELCASPSHSLAWFCWNKLLVRYHKSPEDFQESGDLLLGLLRSPDPSLRPVMADWFRETFQDREGVEEWVRAFLGAGYADVREMGWEWFSSDCRLRTSPTLWTWLARHSNGDLRARFLGFLRDFQKNKPRSLSEHASLDEDALDVLRARVLLTVHDRWGHLSRLVDQLRARLEEEHSSEAEPLLALLAEVLRGVCPDGGWSRSARRLALTAVVKFVARHPELESVLRRELPHLKMIPADRAWSRPVP